MSGRSHDPPLDSLLHLPPLPDGDSQFDTDHPAPKGTGVPTMTDEWASELAAWNVAVERSRFEYDKKGGGWYDARAWPVAQVRTFYAYAFAHPERQIQPPTPHSPEPHRCDRDACADLNRAWWAVYARERRAARKAATV